MDLAPIIARLRDETSGFKVVGGAADLDAIGNGVVPAPAAYVIPISESAAPNDIAGGFAQQVAVMFGVVVIASNLSDATGAAAMGGLEARRAAVRGALLGWVPDATNGATVSFSGGRLLRFGDGLLWWGDDFLVNTYLRT